MIAFWVAAAVLTVAAVVAALFPLLRRTGKQGPGRAEYDITVYKDQLAEIGRDRERGLIGETEAGAATVEIQRRMLKAAPDIPAPEETADDAAPAPGNRALPAAIAIAVVVSAFAFYWVLGSPGMPNRPYAERNIAGEITARQGNLERREVMQLVGKLLDALKKKPNNLKGWMLLGRTYITIDEFEGALAAFRQAVELSGRAPDVAAEYAEAMVIAGDGPIGGNALKLFKAVVAADPFNPKARYYLGLKKAQTGNVRGALQDWIDLASLSPAGAPWLETINQQIATAGKELGLDPATMKPSARATALGLTQGLGAKTPASIPASALPPVKSIAAAPKRGPRIGPSSEDVKAAGEMSAGDRNKMIRSMVRRLADRLEKDPGDLDGWQRLAKAYEVLGEKDKAADVQKRIQALQKK